MSERSNVRSPQKNTEIGSWFDSKFEKKMFMKVANPFNHFRTDKIKTESS